MPERRIAPRGVPSVRIFRCGRTFQFAYKISPAEDQSREILAHLPKWATTDRYSIDARGPANATKDQMRLMVQSLLAERFQLAAHFETKDAAVFNLTLVKSDTLGHTLRPHA